MRRSRKSIQRSLRGIAALAAVAAAVLAASCSREGGVSLPGSQEKFSIPFGRRYNYDDILIVRVVDGDTLKLENGERVRMIGIDTPEMHESQKLYRDARKTGETAESIQAMGTRAYGFTRGLAEGKRVRLEFDVEKKDKYDRLLAYVYLQDGTFINAQIVKQGYASLLTIPPNVAHADEFSLLYREAREAGRGLWGE